MFDPTTGEITERCLDHENGDVERFYGTLSSPARVGIEASVSAPWFERILTRFQHELWVGDTAEIRAARVRKQKTDSRDAQHILDLLLTNRFPRIWMSSTAERDLRQLLRLDGNCGIQTTSLLHSRFITRSADAYLLLGSLLRF
jgi:transposase